MARTKFVADNINNTLDFIGGFALNNTVNGSGISIKGQTDKGVRIWNGIATGGTTPNYYGDLYNNYISVRDDGARIEIVNQMGGVYIGNVNNDTSGGAGTEINGTYGGGVKLYAEYGGGISCLVGSSGGFQINDNNMGNGGFGANFYSGAPIYLRSGDATVGSGYIGLECAAQINIYTNVNTNNVGNLLIRNQSTIGGRIVILNDAPYNANGDGEIYIATNGGQLYMESRINGTWGFGVHTQYLTEQLLWWSSTYDQTIRNTSALKVISQNFLVNGTADGASYNTTVAMQYLQEFYAETHSDDSAMIKIEKRYTDNNNYSNFIIQNNSVPSSSLYSYYLVPGTNHQISNYFTLNADATTDNWIAFFDNDYDNNIYKSVYMYMYHPTLSFNVYGSDSSKPSGYGSYNFSLNLNSLQMQLQNSNGIIFNIDQVGNTAQARMYSSGNGGNNQKTIEMQYAGNAGDRIYIGNYYGTGSCYIELTDSGRVNIMNNAPGYSQSIEMKDDGDLFIRATNGKVVIEGNEEIDLIASNGVINLSGGIAYSTAYLDDTASPYDLSGYLFYHTFICQTNAGAITLNLPEIEGTVIPNGKTWVIKNVGTNLVTINAYSGQFIDSYASQTLAQYESIEITAYYDQSYSLWLWAIV